MGFQQGLLQFKDTKCQALCHQYHFLVCGYEDTTVSTVQPKKIEKITSEDYERQFADVLHKSTTKCTKGNMQTNVNKHISTAKHTRKWGNKKTVQNNNSDRGWWIHMDSKYSKNQRHQELFQSWEALKGLVTFRFDFGTTSRVSLEDLRLRSGS